jgi:hypothetical protein
MCIRGLKIKKSYDDRYALGMNNHLYSLGVKVEPPTFALEFGGQASYMENNSRSPTSVMIHHRLDSAINMSSV